MAKRIATALVEPSAILREGIRRILADSVFSITAAVASLAEIEPLDWLASGELLVGDFGDDPETASAGIRAIRSGHPRIRIMVLADRFDPDVMAAAARAGADGYQAKSISPHALLKSLELVMAGGRVFPAEAHEASARAQPGEPRVEQRPPPPDTSLSEQELKVLRRIVRGEANKVIARELDIMDSTVNAHVKSILRKLRVRNRTQAATWALDHGLKPAPRNNTGAAEAAPDHADASVLRDE